MAPRKSGIKNNIVARLVTGKKLPCAFCNRQVDDELLYGKLYAIGDIQCHYYCVLLSSCLIQKGKDDQGLFGFLYEDILLEIERCKKHKCSYCNHVGANLGCSITQCRKQFHLPCGKEKNSVSLFYGNYKTFCQHHVPKQQIPDTIMYKAKIRKSRDNKVKKKQNCSLSDMKELALNHSDACDSDTQSVCVICYEAVQGYPTINTFWPPCCARDAWFHRTCLQRMALSAGMHYLKCPLCNDKEHFYEAVVSQGYYVPDRDAAWELEQNAFAEIYERPIACSAVECSCPMGRSHDVDNGVWSISICLLCGSSGHHVGCMNDNSLYICDVCKPAAPADLDQLASSIEAVISQEQAQTPSRSRHGPVMPSRMSLRRTKRNIHGQIPSSTSVMKAENESQTFSNTATSRHSLNLKPPRKPDSIQNSEQPSEPSKSAKSAKYESPTKILEEGLKKKYGDDISMKEELIVELRKRFRKPQPLSVKRKIVNDILNGLFDCLLQESKQKEPIKVSSSPKKCAEANDVILVQHTPEIIDLTAQEMSDQKIENFPFDHYHMLNTPNKLKMVDIEKDSSLEISAKDEIVNIDVFKIENTEKDCPKNCTFKFSPCNKDIIAKNIDIDLESFKNRYLSEVGFKENLKSRKRKHDKKIVVEIEKERKLKRRSISIKNKNIQVKIKWRKEQVKLQFNELKKKNKYKQYILKYSPEKNVNNTDVFKCSLSKPAQNVTPMKRKYTKQEKSPDNLVQTSIDKFFKVKLAENE